MFSWHEVKYVNNFLSFVDVQKAKRTKRSFI